MTGVLGACVFFAASTACRGVPAALCVVIGTQCSTELVHAFGQTALADTDGRAADVADGSAKFHVESGGFGEAELLTRVDASVPDHQEGRRRRQRSIHAHRAGQQFHRHHGRGNRRVRGGGEHRHETHSGQ